MSTWYAVRLLFESRINGEAVEGSLWEESLRLVCAESEADARVRGERLGEAAEHGYANESGQVVSWHFDSVMEVVDLCEAELTDGVEVSSRLFRRDPSES